MACQRRAGFSLLYYVLLCMLLHMLILRNNDLRVSTLGFITGRGVTHDVYVRLYGYVIYLIRA
jgi:hypothetical protein